MSPALPVFSSQPSAQPLFPAFPSPMEILISLKRFYCSWEPSSPASRGNTMSFNIPAHSPDSCTSGHLEQRSWDCFIWQWLATPCCLKNSHHVPSKQLRFGNQTINRSHIHGRECGQHVAITLKLHPESLALAGYNISTHESIYPLVNQLPPGLLQERLSKAPVGLATAPPPDPAGALEKAGLKIVSAGLEKQTISPRSQGKQWVLRGSPERVSRVKGGTGFFWIEDKECVYVPPEKWPW